MGEQGHEMGWHRRGLGQQRRGSRGDYKTGSRRDGESFGSGEIADLKKVGRGGGILPC